MNPTISPDALIEQAAALNRQAIALLSKPDFSAEDAAAVEKMQSDAAVLATRSDQLSGVLEAGRAYANRLQEADTEAQERQRRNAQPRGWAHLGEFLQAVKRHHKRLGTDPRLLWFDETGPSEGHSLSEGEGIAGGFLTPAEYMPQVQAVLVGPNAIVRPRATVIPMNRVQVQMPVLNQYATTAGQAHWFAGMLFYWEAENAQINEVSQSFGMETLTAHMGTAYTVVSDQALADSAQSIAALITGPLGFGPMVQWYEDWAFLNGDGVGKPLGVLNSPACIESTRAGSGVTYEDLTGMMNHMLPSANYAWVINLALRSAFLNMTGPTDNTDKFYLWGDMVNGQPDRLFGMPVFWTEKAPAADAKGDVGLHDFSHYFVGDRQATTVDVSDQVRWLNNQTAFKVVHRVGGRPWLKSYFTLYDCTSTISPFIALAAAS